MPDPFPPFDPDAAVPWDDGATTTEQAGPDSPLAFPVGTTTVGDGCCGCDGCDCVGLTGVTLTISGLDALFSSLSGLGGCPRAVAYTTLDGDYPLTSLSVCGGTTALVHREPAVNPFGVYINFRLAWSRAVTGGVATDTVAFVYDQLGFAAGGGMAFCSGRFTATVTGAACCESRTAGSGGSPAWTAAITPTCSGGSPEGFNADSTADRADSGDTTADYDADAASQRPAVAAAPPTPLPLCRHLGPSVTGIDPDRRHCEKYDCTTHVKRPCGACDRTCVGCPGFEPRRSEDAP